MRWAVAGALLLLSPSALAAQRTENVVLIVTDGLRWSDAS